MELLDVSDKEDRRICSLAELPKAVRGLMAWRKIMDRGDGRHIPLYLRTTIQILDELAMMLQTKEEEDSPSS
jgi:hypothetical protein